MPSPKPLFQLRDREVGVSFKVVEIADSIFAEERAGHRAVKSDTQRQLSDDIETFCGRRITHFHNSSGATLVWEPSTEGRLQRTV